jgi:hypothetical protein
VRQEAERQRAEQAYQKTEQERQWAERPAAQLRKPGAAPEE